MLGAAVIIIATIVVYLPAIRGGFIWDDPDYVINNHTLRDLSGLLEMWTRPMSLPQWYPMVHTSFWIEYHLWGLSAAGYHLTNVLLHIVAALLLWRLLGMLEVPGSWLAAAIFALHPIEVESVAWITERKNVLSGGFYLLSLLAYLRFVGIGEDRMTASDGSNRRDYIMALAFFLAALLSKTVTATLPAAILVIIWWKRGSIRRRDIVHLIPFFILGIGLGLLTAYLEVHRVGASGERIAELNFSIPDRILIAGHAVWFYAQKLLVPWPLAFIYPRWDVNPHVWWQWLYPIGAVAVIALLALGRRRLGRAPLAAVLLYCGTLFPALGFFNVYPMRFSFVADHFQYHAGMALIALLASLICRFIGSYGRIVLVPLAVLTAMRTPVYADAETLWWDTLAKNEKSWMVHTNLAHVLLARAERTNDERLYQEAEQHYLRAFELAPNIYETHGNVGMMLGRRKQYTEALEHLEKALTLNPQFSFAWFSIGQIYEHQNQPEKAIESYRKAIEIVPNYPEANQRLATALEREGKLAEAAEHYRVALGSKPDDFVARFGLGSCLVRLGQFDEAAYNLKEATRLDPNSARAWLLLGVAQLKTGQQSEAFRSAQRAQELDPSLTPRK